jgi:hypothetical protein
MPIHKNMHKIKIVILPPFVESAGMLVKQLSEPQGSYRFGVMPLSYKHIDIEIIQIHAIIR